MKLKLKKRIKLGKLSPGSLFLCHGTIALKSEYRTNGKPDAYILGSGEAFWGGCKTADELNNLEVIKIEVKGYD